MKTSVGAFGVLLVLLIFLGVTQGQENKQCRKSGGIPVKVEIGYECIKAPATSGGKA